MNRLAWAIGWLVIVLSALGVTNLVDFQVRLTLPGAKIKGEESCRRQGGRPRPAYDESPEGDTPVK